MRQQHGMEWHKRDAEGGADAMKVALEKQLNVHYLAELMGSRWANYIRHAPPEQIRPLALGKVSLCPSMITWLKMVDSFTRLCLGEAWLSLLHFNRGIQPGCSIESAKGYASVDWVVANAWVFQLPLGH